MQPSGLGSRLLRGLPSGHRFDSGIFRDWKVRQRGAAAVSKTVLGPGPEFDSYTFRQFTRVAFISLVRRDLADSLVALEFGLHAANIALCAALAEVVVVRLRVVLVDRCVRTTTADVTVDHRHAIVRDFAALVPFGLPGFAGTTFKLSAGAWLQLDPSWCRPSGAGGRCWCAP